MQSLMDQLELWIEEILVKSGIPEPSVIYFRLGILLFATILVSLLIFWITKKIIQNYIYRLVKKSPITWDDFLAEHQVLNNVSHLIPALFFKQVVSEIFQDFESLIPMVIKLTDSYLILVGLSIVKSFLKVGEFALSKQDTFKDKPLSSYFQLIRIILYITAAILILSLLMGKSPIYFLSAFGAMTAVLLLVFKDTILGLVASVQMSSNDMVRVGDWVEMPKFNADGNVIAINLHTVKIQNFDRTITTIPTYYFITDSFKNWRGMVESGGRRIKRAIYVNAHSVKFIDQNQREHLQGIQLISNYLTKRQKEIEAYNQSHQIDTSILINGRRMTNLGVFRKYIESYLHHHPRIRKNMTILVRQLTIEDRGIPIELYCFTNTTEWLEYEEIQADIFDHLLAAATFFELDLFQQPSGKDISQAIHQASGIIQSSAPKQMN
ncbi:mechanosensitive ion channel family protein [Algoriphagus sanaruensis]|uniref:Mechanosensitive ion channel protein MscS n=1 Tax=Algoriphagus sanaruensis TaxID=1727163 RepID=A0A142EPK2_9BACT|nr:mechanosensitive ion channel domain-containing protein [Algoriphagus sanaruensis]AMQ57057.1 mechanosensitive ion channel protein MscS [Algoriphagus sanaruensis]